MDSSATVVWTGSLKQGEGKISTESGALKASTYTFGTRFEANPGTNPEELIAAAHASCFTMALANELGQVELTPEEIHTTAKITLSTADNDFKISQSHLDVKLKLKGGDRPAFQKAADTAKAHCPVSKLLNAEITMDFELIA